METNSLLQPKQNEKINMKYYLHRISYEWDIAYSLLENGLLSIGWSELIRILKNNR